MREVGLVACVVLAGCNAAFGLEPTISIDANEVDFDVDGIADAVDNCPELANADQANSDGDAFGDACDTCPSLASASAHDEDADGAGDACDFCPGVPDFANDTDGDGVGDICDPKPAMNGNTRAAFDTFVTLSSDWQAATIPWIEKEDAVAPTDVVPMSDAGLVNTTVTATPPWRVTIGFESGRPWSTSDQAAISARIGNTLVICRISCPSPNCSGSVEQNGTVLSGTAGLHPHPLTRVVFSVDVSGAYQCKWDDAGVGSTFNFSTNVPAVFGAVASPDVHATYFEVIR